MAKSWVRSLGCKSNAVEDVAHSPTSSKKPALLPLSSCSDPSLALKDVALLFPKYPSSKSHHRARSKRIPKPLPFPPSPISPPAIPSFLTLTELPEGHSSRRVVEIIFTSSWSSTRPFPGEIEVLFRVHTPARTVARFEEYRIAVRARSAPSGDPRCAADGNEMMRFHCGDPVSPPQAAAEGVRTFARSGCAHDSAGGGAGRRAMMVCRVIAGRVRSESDPESEGDSVRLGKGELVASDPRAVLPCFLIIYKV
ncbi:uncharacterized protein [Typha latifolia]|uniref:uncharacterized protein n=1 Tax=Typha latifolia TaxID=4733 RepID=UPI003C2EAEA1